MQSDLKVCVLFLALLGSAYAVSAPSRITRHSCTSADVLTAFSCVLKIAKLVEELETVEGRPSKETLTKLKTSCNEIKDCVQVMKCGDKEKYETMMKKTDILCDAIDFFPGEFHECMTLLEKKNSECFKTFSLTMKKGDPKSCKDLVAKNKCMREEIKRECGVDMWNKTKKNLLSMDMEGRCTEDDFQ